MKILKRSERARAKLSFVLLDWSVRESFHFLHYLERQAVPRDDFEVLVIEYYSRESEALRPYVAQVDAWVLLEMPPRCYYHKHLMYNLGIVLARGDVIVICDSDAMARDTLVGTILQAFARDPDLVLHLDQFRNSRRDLYPFNFPTFEDVLGPGCINNRGGQTKGIAEPDDPLHERNYGACMCARRSDLIAIGGADEHLDYLGHICGPYDMTFRLVNFGRREVWHESEFLYHTWHPGQAGADNYLGPHDGRHMSTTALEALATRRVKPYVENPLIRRLREGARPADLDVERQIVAPDRIAMWSLIGTSSGGIAKPADEGRTTFDYRGYRLERQAAGYSARLIIDSTPGAPEHAAALEGGTVAEVRRRVDRAIGSLPRLVSAGGSLLLLTMRAGKASLVMARRLAVRMASLPRRAWGALRAVGVRSIDRVRRFFMEQNRASGSLLSIVVNLSALRRGSGDAHGGERPVLLTDARAIAFYVRTLTAIGVLPHVDVALVRGGEIDAWALQSARRADTTPLFVGRELYARHHAAFASTGVSRRMTVL